MYHHLAQTWAFRKHSRAAGIATTFGFFRWVARRTTPGTPPSLISTRPGKLTVCYWKCVIYSWFTHSKGWCSIVFSMFTRGLYVVRLILRKRKQRRTYGITFNGTAFHRFNFPSDMVDKRLRLKPQELRLILWVSKDRQSSSCGNIIVES